MEVALVVPWRPDGGHRDVAWAHIRHRLEVEHPTWEIIEGRHTEGDWCKAAAVADALTRTRPDVLVIHDADVYCDGLRLAVGALDGHPWAIPHYMVNRLTQEATVDVLAGGEMGGQLEQRPYKGWAGGGILALHRDTYERVPLDPRFVGWGQEDAAWHLALTRITGRGWRGRADLWHLWHPPQPRLCRQIGSDASAALLHRYRQARTAETMAALLEEVTCGERPHHPEPQGCP